jgi:hypothetical protein
MDAQDEKDKIRFETRFISCLSCLSCAKKFMKSNNVKDNIGQGLVSHPYRVLRLLRRVEGSEQCRRSVHRELYRPQGIPHSLKQFSPVMDTKAVGDVMIYTEAYTKRAQGTCSWRDCRGRRAWHVQRDFIGTWEPHISPGKTGRGKRARASFPICHVGVRPPHSTLRRESRSLGEGGGNFV